VYLDATGSASPACIPLAEEPERRRHWHTVAATGFFLGKHFTTTSPLTFYHGCKFTTIVVNLQPYG
jgi:hypothetical protein